MPKYPALVIIGDEVRNAGLTSDTDDLRILIGRHLGTGVDSGLVYDDDDEVKVESIGGKDVKRGDVDDNEVTRCLDDNELDDDDASLSIVELLSYNSSSQTNIRLAISNISVGPPERVVRLGGGGEGIVVSSSLFVAFIAIVDLFIKSTLLLLLPSTLS
jgi:hypothetical protein